MSDHDIYSHPSRQRGLEVGRPLEQGIRRYIDGGLVGERLRLCVKNDERHPSEALRSFSDRSELALISAHPDLCFPSTNEEDILNSNLGAKQTTSLVISALRCRDQPWPLHSML